MTIIICGSSRLKEDYNTFRTTPQEHWWIWPECPMHA